MANRAKTVTAAVAAVVAAGLTMAHADAGTLTMTGTLTATDGGGNSFTNDPFSAVASFNWNDGSSSPGSGNVEYASDLSITINNNGTDYIYNSIPADFIDTVIWNPGHAPVGNYAVEIDATGGVVGATGNFTGFFNTLTWVDPPGNDVLSQPMYESSGTFEMPLENGNTLDIAQFNLDPSATLGVPEPASLALLGAGLAGTIAARRRRHTKGQKG